jgi:hypothetical protein
VFTLLEEDRELRVGGLPPHRFNDSGMSFLPKGSEDGDLYEVIREYSKTRPISTKNTDNKIIMGANVRVLSADYKTNTHPSQNGFVSGRNLLNNILDIDSAGRLYSLKFEDSAFRHVVSNTPAIVAMDFATAFPSIIHDWIWAVLRHRNLPEDFLKLFQGLYHNATATYTYNGTTHTLITFKSGVLQGCPGSAFLFNNALDPFLYLITKTLRARAAGIARACADDIGLTLRRLAGLKLIYPFSRKRSPWRDLRSSQ